MRLIAKRIRIRGLVQGVGFRPAMHRLATTLNVNGWVCNDGNGVLIHVEGPVAYLDAFSQQLTSAIPTPAHVEAISEEPATCEDVADFQIRVHTDIAPSSVNARVPIDRAICGECRADVQDPTNRRYRHAFATCTQCGPRFSIIREMPYERHHTSMAGFGLCKECAVEYEDADNRRFHAEPIACVACGPRLSFSTGVSANDRSKIVGAAQALRLGQIVALKGLGGYQLLVRADNEDAVARLRERKRRPTKPFAVMVRSIEDAEHLAFISTVERALLLDADNAIVLTQSRNKVANAVAPGLRQLGVMLPTTPLHLLLLSQVDFPVVATSGNQSDEPIAIDDIGRDSLEAIADGFLDHDRPIVRRLDDSVIRVIDERPMVFRLARGYAPCVLPALERWAARSPVPIPPILAVGGQQKTALAIWTGGQVILGQHLGDMDHPDSRRAFACAAADLARLYRCEPRLHACDLHPDYFTTRWAQSSGLATMQVQHHHAHAVACMVEHDLLDRDVLAIIFDGTGFGIDGTIWGGEILHASMREFRRVASLDPFALPGGEAAIHEPNRIALSLLAATFGCDAIPGWLLERIAMPEKRCHALLTMIERGIQSPITSSVGRLFDGVAALLLKVALVTYEGEAPLMLENAVDPHEASAYPIEVGDGFARADWRPLIRCLTDDLARDVDVGICAARFHNALAAWAAVIASRSPFDDVVLGGGCFQNAFLTSRTRTALEAIGKRVHVPSRIPANDGGLAAGQLAVAMARWRLQSQEVIPCVSAFPAD